jgi:hypothetical protein
MSEPRGPYSTGRKGTTPCTALNSFGYFLKKSKGVLPGLQNSCRFFGVNSILDATALTTIISKVTNLKAVLYVGR